MEPSTGGSGEVHAHLSSQPDKGEGMSGKFDSPAGAADRARDFASRARDRTEDFVESTRERSGEFRGRLGDATHRARDRAERFIDETEDSIDERTGILSSARSHPIAALGVAFAVGFMLAGDGDPARHPAIGKTKNQIKGAIMGGVSAAISQQLRSFIEEQGGIGGLLTRLGIPMDHADEDPYLTPDHGVRDL